MALLPLGAMLLAGSMGALAQDAAKDPTPTLKTVTVTEKAEQPEGKDALRATTTTIGKGKQNLRDIPQSVTVVTEKLVDDRNLDTLKDVLHHTAGVTFQAAEGGEEDIRLRGFSLATTGDIYQDGLRDPAFYDRDTFNNDRIELLRGSASMLFGRGSTGGAVNQVSKQARSFLENEVTTTVGSFNYVRVTGDFNIATGEDSALRINAMANKADNNGSGSKIDKRGIAANYQFGMGTEDAFSLSLYSLDTNNGMNYGMPWTTTKGGTDQSMLQGIKATDNYGLASDYNKSTANYVTLSHTHRFQDNSELKTSLRKGIYTRDLRSGAVRLCSSTGNNPVVGCPAGTLPTEEITSATRLTRGQQTKIQDFDTTYVQSDFSTKATAWGVKHEILAGVDMAQEAKRGYSAASITKPTTTIGTPNDGASVNEGARKVTLGNAFQGGNLGLYAQDMVQVAPNWKVLGGLRFDQMRGDYDVFNPAGAKTASFSQTIADWSERLGALYQPNELHSYHISYGTSFNTSADTYSYSTLSNNANIAPEQSRNFELGAKLDSADKRFSTRLAVFHSTKMNERNTDPDSATATPVLSGRRSTAGLEIDISGLLTNKWEVFGSYMWMPHARVDATASCPVLQVGQSCSQNANSTNGLGARPGLTPVHSGSIWTTYQFTPEFRAGSGLNFRSEQHANTSRNVYTKAYGTVDLMAEYKLGTRQVIKANLINLFDTYYADSVYNGHYIPGSARNLQVSLNIKF